MNRTWIKAAGVRMIKTIAQAAIAAIGSAAVLEQVDWKVAISTAILAGILSLCTSIAGLPEVNTGMSEADRVNAMVTDAPTIDVDNAAELKAIRKEAQK